MRYYNNIIKWICDKGAILAAVSMIFIMMLLVANVVVRPFGGVIKANYELIDIVSSVAIAFCLVYAGLHHHHIVIRILTERFTQLSQTRIRIFTSFSELVFWALVCWRSVAILNEHRWVVEITEQARIPVLPFRLIWTFGILLFCLVIIGDLITAVQQGRRKWN